MLSIRSFKRHPFLIRVDLDCPIGQRCLHLGRFVEYIIAWLNRLAELKSMQDAAVIEGAAGIAGIVLIEFLNGEDAIEVAGHHGIGSNAVVHRLRHDRHRPRDHERGDPLQRLASLEPRLAAVVGQGDPANNDSRDNAQRKLEVRLKYQRTNDGDKQPAERASRGDEQEIHRQVPRCRF
jgi:hypothetical protein